MLLLLRPNTCAFEQLRMEAAEEETRPRDLKVIRLIKKATNSTAPEVDPRLLKAIKSVVRYSDWELRASVQTLMDLMKRKHSQVRYLSLLIIDVLFMRSKLFRTLIVVNLDHLLNLSIAFRGNHSLPPPASVATTLRSKAIEFLEKWNVTYGIHYRQLRLGYDYLKNTLRIRFPNLQENAARTEQERTERQMRTMEILRKKFEVLRENLPSIKADIQSTIDEISECLEVARCDDRSSDLKELLDDEEEEGACLEFRTSELRRLRHSALRESEKVMEDGENKVVFDTLRELYRLLIKKHLISVQEWINVLIRVELDDSRLVESMLKDLINIRNQIQATKLGCEELGCALPCLSNEEEDIWEEGAIERVEMDDSVPPAKTVGGNSAVASTSTTLHLNKDRGECSDKGSSSQKNKITKDPKKDSDPLRNKLLTEAPVVKWGVFLDTWGTRRDVLANQRGLELENHWGRVDNDAVIPSEKIAEINVHATVYEEDHVEIQPCRAPLRKGGLCQRRDLRVCPFHGPIIPCDEDGKPIHPQNCSDGNDSQGTGSDSDRKLTEQDWSNSHGTVGDSDMKPTQQDWSAEESNLEMDKDLADQLAERAVKNVRLRDKEEIKKRENDRRLLKRAKLAKVREHNQAVMREAAMASTSMGTAGEYSDSLNLEGEAVGSSKNQKATLASMLKKKVKPKHRIAMRLLSNGAKDATIRQLAKDEHTNYRESFPNQW